MGGPGKRRHLSQQWRALQRCFQRLDTGDDHRRTCGAGPPQRGLDRQRDGGLGGFNGSIRFNDGARYNPSANSWTGESTAGAPAARDAHAAMWAGGEMIVMGGFGGTGSYFNDTFSYNPTRTLYLYQR